MSQIIVVGAGPLGMMAALSLSKQGQKVLLIGPEPAKDGRTTAILNQGISFLKTINVWQKLSDQTAPMRFMRIADGTKRLIRAPEAHFDAAEIGLSSFGHNIENTGLLAALQESIDESDAIDVIRHTVIDALIEPENVILSLGDGSTIKGHFIVAADGKNSLLRGKAGINTSRWSYPQTALVTNLRHTKDHLATSTELHTENGPFTLVPLRKQASSLVWVDKPEKVESLLNLPEKDLGEQISKKAHYILGDMEIITKPMAYPLSGLLAQSYGKGLIALVGESAHIFPPIGAQGMNLGIRDILSLTKYLHLSDNNLIGLADAYSNDRKSDIQLRTGAVDALNRTLLSGMLPAHFGRGLGIYMLNNVPFLRKFVMKQGLGTTS